MNHLASQVLFNPAGHSSVPEQLLRDISSLLLTSELVGSSLVALRPECMFSPALVATLDATIALCDKGAPKIQASLIAEGIVWPTATDTSGSALITGFFTRLPSDGDQQIFATELIVNLQLLAQHIELKSRIASEEALIIGLADVGRTLADWSHEWQTWGHKIGTAAAHRQPHPVSTRSAKNISHSSREPDQASCR